MRDRVYNRYPEEWEEWLKANYSSPTLEEDFYKQFGVHKALNPLRQKCRSLGLKIQVSLTEDKIKWLKENYPNCSNNAKLVKDFNDKFNTNYDRRGITQICVKHGIKKKVHAKYKDKRHPIGHEIIDSRGQVFVKYRNYYPEDRKIHGMQNYMPKARYMYEKYHNTKLKHGEVIIFLDGNHYNFRKSNLECVTRAESGKLQGYGWRINSKITKAGIEVLRTEKLIEEMEEE